MHNRGSRNILRMLEKDQKRTFRAASKLQISQASPVLVCFLCGQVCNSELSPAARRYLYNLQGKEGGKEGREVKREGKTLGGRRRGSEVKREAGRRKLESYQILFLGTEYGKKICFFKLFTLFSSVFSKIRLPSLKVTSYLDRCCDFSHLICV